MINYDAILYCTILYYTILCYTILNDFHIMLGRVFGASRHAAASVTCDPGFEANSNRLIIVLLIILMLMMVLLILLMILLVIIMTCDPGFEATPRAALLSCQASLNQKESFKKLWFL